MQPKIEAITINKNKVRSISKKKLTIKILETLSDLKSDFKEFKNIIYNE